VFVYTTSLRE